MGQSHLGWLDSLFHFSFAEYYNPDNIQFGVLRVINDDLINPKTGFDTHPHKDMEIISYVVTGALTHGDTMGHESVLTRGQVQYMSAGTGVYHSEHNMGDTVARFLQIWILPDEKGHKPSYGDYKFEWRERENKWLHIVSNKNGEAVIKINQDVNIYVLALEQGNETEFVVGDMRQAYLIQIEGNSKINDVILKEKDGMEIVEETILIQTLEKSHFMIIEMAKSK